jgi:hypothetical protein
LDEFILFFLPSLKKKKEMVTPTHIAHIAKAPRANAPTKALSKSLQSQRTADRNYVAN